MGYQDSHRVATRVRSVPSEQEEQRATQAVDVGPRIDMLGTHGLFRRH